jgi:transcriptional regulator with XRE-family HTH domain
MDVPPNVGKLMRAVRLLLGLRQIEIARHVGISPTTLSQWERGWRRPTAEQADRVFQVLRDRDRVRRENPL